MRESAYIKTKPAAVRFALNYSDNSGERLAVSLTAKQKDILIKDGINQYGVLIAVDEIDWLIQVLEDIKSFTQLPSNEQSAQVSDEPTS
jgi:hypothetical protein